MSTISTHILDTSLGRPAADVLVTLERVDDAAQSSVASARTDANGRVAKFSEPFADVTPGTYRLGFATAEYFARTNRPVFYPEIVVSFRIDADHEHFHIPLLMSPFGYSTYRGS